jgi:hypothetical protein
VVEEGLDPLLPSLEQGVVYTWEELGPLFGLTPDYLARAGGMVSRPDLKALLLITHSQAGRSFSYEDEWIGNELVYAGRGLKGDQELKGPNRYVAENSHALFLFEHAGSRKLLFHGRVSCVRHWESTGFDKERRERRVFRFLLRGLGKSLNPANRVAVPDISRADPKLPRVGHRHPSFQPRPFDPNRTPSERRKSAPHDPESQRVLSEQADKAHQETLRRFGLWLEAENWEDLEEVDGAIDLQAKRPRGVAGPRQTLFEIKSIRPGTERARVRSGLAQLLEYRFFLGNKTDRLCLVSDRPISERRLRVLDSLAIGHAYLEDGNVVPSGTPSTYALFPRAR